MTDRFNGPFRYDLTLVNSPGSEKEMLSLLSERARQQRHGKVGDISNGVDVHERKGLSCCSADSPESLDREGCQKILLLPRWDNGEAIRFFKV